MGGMLTWSRCRLLHFLYVNSVETFAAFNNFITDIVVLADLVSEAAVVYEDFLVGFILDNETKSFGLIEEFNFTCFH